MSEFIKSQSAEQAQANLDALFQMDAPRINAETTPEPKRPNIPPMNGDALTELPIHLLDDFATGADRQPFRDYTPEELEELKDSITRNGIIQPLIVRRKAGGRYEIIAGHNRRKGAKEVGYVTVPCILRDLSDEDAILQMVSTNLQQRKKLLPSEKAFAYKLQMDALKRQGQRSDLTLLQSATKSDTATEIGKMANESRYQVFRYIRLTCLIPELLKRVDSGEIGLTIGATLSYLRLENQQAVERYCFIDHRHYISQDIADKLKKADKEGVVFDDGNLQPLVQLTVKGLRTVTIPVKKLQRYFPEGTSEKDIEKTIEKALSLYFEK